VIRTPSPAVPPLWTVTDEVGPPDPAQAVLRAAGWGIRTFELRGTSPRTRAPDFLQPSDLARLTDALKQTDSRIAAVSPGLFKSMFAGDTDSHATERLARTIDLARQLGAQSITVFTGVAGEDLSRLVDRLTRAKDQCARANLELHIENGSHTSTGTSAQLAEIAARVDVRGVWDPANAVASGDAALHLAAELLHGRIARVHVKGFSRTVGRCVDAGARDDDVHWPGHLASLRRSGFAGPFVVEPHQPDGVEHNLKLLQRMLDDEMRAPKVRSGMVSVTFRKESVERIVELTRDAGLDGIEWGGDVHVPPGDTAAAERARSLTEQAGLSVLSYASYYRAGHDEPQPGFEVILDTALQLGTTLIRVWPGTRGSAGADAAYRDRVAADLRSAADLAAAHGVTIGLEFHGGTLTDDIQSTLDLLRAVDRDHVLTYWQPPNGVPFETSLAGLERIAPHVVAAHAFYWWPDSMSRFPLADGADRWPTYLRTLRDRAPRLRHAALEFVRGDDPQQLAPDAKTLIDWLGV
jgi:3-dehydroshikimate dehydratase